MNFVPSVVQKLCWIKKKKKDKTTITFKPDKLHPSFLLCSYIIASTSVVLNVNGDTLPETFLQMFKYLIFCQNFENFQKMGFTWSTISQKLKQLEAWHFHSRITMDGGMFMVKIKVLAIKEKKLSIKNWTKITF